MNRKYLIIIASVLFVSQFANGQTAAWQSDFGLSLAQTDFKSKRVIPPSPEAAELGKYGNTPVSLFTGTPQISIPLYELKGNTLSLPISLSYNASGFKPQDVAPWTGLGWSLNAGGVVTRSVVGNPDIVGNYFNSSFNYLNIPVVNDLYAKYDYIYNMQKAWMETQPDMYFYNFGNYSGKFLINKDQVVNKKKKDNLKISHCITCPSSTMTILDDNGVTYEFDDVEYSSMTLDDGVTSNIPAYMSYNNYPTTWNITSMTSADGQEQILFEYYTTDGVHTLFQNFLQNGSATYYRTNQYASISWTGATGPLFSVPPTVTVKRKYLKKITLKRGGLTVSYIDFISTPDQRQDLDHTNFPQERLLQGINVYANNALVKQYNLTTSYFVNGINKRLRLDAVQEMAIGTGTASKPPFAFQYDNSMGVPSINAASVDHWGFYNGTDNVSTLIPNANTGDGTILGMGANRNPDLGGSSCAILNKITYPTGGYTMFDYELHQANDYNTSFLVGGIRVKKITDYSFANNQAIVKNYDYTMADGLTPSGVAGLPNYTKSSTFHYYTEGTLGGTSPPDYDTYYFTISASSVFGLGAVKGSHIGYSRVTEYQTDAVTGAQLGRTVYKYNIGNRDENNDDASNGALTEQTSYDNSGKIIDDVSNIYQIVGTSGTIGYKLVTDPAQDNHFVLCKGTLDNGVTYFYEWHSDWATLPSYVVSTRNYLTRYSYVGYIVGGQDIQLVQQDTKKYDQLSNSYIAVTKKYTYGNPAHTLPTLIEQTSSSGDEIATIKKYAGDYTLPASGTLDNPTLGIQFLQGKNMVGAEIESIQYRKNLDGSNLRYLSGMLTMYKPFNPYPNKLYRTELAAPVTSFQQSATNGTFSYDLSYKLLGTFNYDAYGNLREQIKAQDMTKSYIWDYNYTLPTAEVTNANAAMIAYTSFEPLATGGNWMITNLTANTVTGGITGSSSYILQAGNSITDIGFSSTRQYKVSYWSLGGSTATVNTDAGNAPGTAIVVHNGWTYYECLLPVGSTSVTITGSGVTIDELRLCPKDALMSTVTYIPSVGISSQCSPSGQLMYYEYDGLNRLINVRDNDKNIVKNYKYNYGLGAAIAGSPQTLFYSNTAQGTYTKQGCPIGSTPTSVTYTVGFGKYISSTGQPDADGKANAELIANGQANANANGQCLYYSAAASGFAFKNDCLASQGFGSRVVYTVPAGAYSSTVDQPTADLLATTDVANNKQSNANRLGSCSCGGEGQKYIGTSCTNGTRYNKSTAKLLSGQWQCIYYYQFSDGTISQDYTEVNQNPCNSQ